MRASMDPLRVADTAYEAEAADDGLPRKDRDAARQRLYEALVVGRDRLRGVFGAESLPIVGFAGPTPTEVTAVLAYGAQVVAALQQPRLPPLRDSRDAHVPPGVVEEVGTALQALRATQDVVLREGRELTAAAAARNAALDAQAATFTTVAQLGVSLLRLAEQHALAERLRPSARRRGLTAAEENEPLPGEPAPPPNEE